MTRTGHYSSGGGRSLSDPTFDSLDLHCGLLSGLKTTQQTLPNDDGSKIVIVGSLTRKTLIRQADFRLPVTNS